MNKSLICRILSIYFMSRDYTHRMEERWRKDIILFYLQRKWNIRIEFRMHSLQNKRMSANVSDFTCAIHGKFPIVEDGDTKWFSAGNRCHSHTHTQWYRITAPSGALVIWPWSCEIWRFLCVFYLCPCKSTNDNNSGANDLYWFSVRPPKLMYNCHSTNDSNWIYRTNHIITHMFV